VAAKKRTSSSSTTTPKAKVSTRRADSRKSGSVKLGYHIFRNDDRYDVLTRSGHVYQGNLPYVREHTGSDEEGSNYLNQFTMMTCKDGPEFCMLYGCYRLLICLGARQTRPYRGWLLGADKQPFTDSQLGQLLNIPTKLMTKILKRFLSVKLIEKIELPDFESMTDEPEGEDATQKKPKKSEGKTKKKSPKSKKKTRSSAAERTPAHEVNEVRSPLKKQKKNKIGNKTKEKNNPDRIMGTQTKAHEGQRRNEGQSKAERQSETRNHPSPAAAPTRPENPTDPIDPTPSDASEGAKVIAFPQAPSSSDNASPPGSRPTSVPSGRASSTAHRPASRPVSARRGRGDPVAVGDVMGDQRHRYDAEAMAFGEAIFTELGLDRTFSRGSTEGRSEICSYASTFRKLTAGLSAPVVTTIKNRALVHAAKVRRNAKRCRSPGAVWMKAFQGMCLKYATEADVAAG